MSHTISAVFSGSLLVLMLSLFVYNTSDRVASMEKNVKKINAQIEAERQSLHVLKAEWTYLTNPTRIDAAAKKHLALQPTVPKRVFDTTTLASALPLRAGEATVQIAAAQPAAPAAVAPAATPSIASVGVARKTGSYAVASRSGAHINDRVVMQRAAVAEASTDSIGSLIQSLGGRQ